MKSRKSSTSKNINPLSPSKISSVGIKKSLVKTTPTSQNVSNQPTIEAVKITPTAIDNGSQIVLNSDDIYDNIVIDYNKSAFGNQTPVNLDLNSLGLANIERIRVARPSKPKGMASLIVKEAQEAVSKISMRDLFGSKKALDKNAI